MDRSIREGICMQDVSIERKSYLYISSEGAGGLLSLFGITLRMCGISADLQEGFLEMFIE